MIETEKTYLAKYLPDDLDKSRSEEIIDLYLPEKSRHPKLRIRKKGENYEITKKSYVKQGDASVQEEKNIILTREEFEEVISGKKRVLRKKRYYYHYKGRVLEIDVFLDNLRGLVLIETEFDSKEEKEAYISPEFCLEDVTQEDFIAGGMLAGKTYRDIQENLEKYNYKQILK